MPADLPDLSIPAPAKGLIEGLDPAAASYPPDASPDLENIRVSGGLWEPRLGMAVSIAAEGSGAGRLLTTHYTPSGRYRLMARGNTTAAVLYKLLVGTDAAWVATTGGTGLGNSSGDAFQGVSLGGRYYFTDRQNGLKVWNPADNTVAAVAQPTAPTNAPRVVKRTYALFDAFSGSEPYGWTESDGTNFYVEAYTASELPSAGSYGAGTVRSLTVDATGALGDTITKDRPAYPVPSFAMAFWLEMPGTRAALVTLEYGITAAAQFSTKLDPGEAEVTKILFVPIGAIGSLSYFRFRCVRDPASTQNVIVGPLMLPGNLQGRYRWVYTHYDPSTGEESAPSPYSNDGEFSDFSQVGTSYDNSTAENEGSALYKSAAVIPESDSGTDAATTRIRVYRQGGVAELTKNAQGEDILTRVGEIPDLVTQLDGAESAASTEIKLDAVGNGGGNLDDGDGLLFEEGIEGKEEIGRVAHLRLFDIVVDDGVSPGFTLSCATRPFTADDVGGEIVLSGKTSGSSGAITAGTYPITSVNTGVATITGDPGDTGATAYGYLKAVNSSTKRVFLADGLLYAHADDATVKCVFLDNVADAAVDASNTLDRERDTPPSGVRSVAKATDGRLWLFGWPLRPMGYAVSNKPTPERTRDYEVFPDNVDPYTRRSETQGFRDDLAGDNSGDAIVWGGLFNGTMTALSRKGLWQVYASGQADFGRTSVQKLFDTGCIATDTVQIVNDALYWVAPGPRVMRWNGQPGSEPQDISFLRCNVTLKNAPSAYWGKWWAQAHADRDGAYYRLWIVPSGETTVTKRLDYNILQDACEPVRYYTSVADAIPFACGTVLDVSSDVGELLALHASSGVTYQMETGSTDANEVIRVRAVTKKFSLGGAVSLLRSFWLRLAAVTDSLSVSITTGGSQYGDVTNAYNTLSVSGSGDKEVKQRVAFNQKGRWVQFTLTGSLSNRASLRELGVWFSRIRNGKVG